VFICYLGALADPELVKRVKKKLSQIDIDGILDSNYINEMIRDRRYSMFKTCGSTERPDVVASKLLEGRVAIMVDGSPAVITVPYLFSESFQAEEDYYLNFWVASVGRFLRYVCFFLTISVPAIYLALLLYHQRLLPTFFLLSAAQSRSGVPFSSLVECLSLILVLEILKETGARMPQNLGHTLSIVGGLVVGQAAVEAKLVSAPMLIAVAVSGIAGLMIPRLRAAVFYLRLIMVLLAATLGLLGCFLGLTLILVRILSISSFGVPYLSSLGMPTVQGLKDTAVRLPWTVMKTRPVFNRNLKRQGEHKHESN
jgi:spore germination protein KA